jgi:hypothetical protein
MDGLTAWQNRQLNRYQAEIDADAQREYAIEKLFDDDQELLVAIREADWTDTIERALNKHYERIANEAASSRL